MFKVGDRVLIIKKSNKNITWVSPEMDKFIGNTGIITEIDYKKDNVYCVRLDEDSYQPQWGFEWEFDCESLVNERELKLKKILNV